MMTAPRQVRRQQVLDQPYIVWNEYVSLLARSKYKDLSEIQRAAHLVFWYESEVQNGGHLQYFENQGTKRLGEVIAALQRLGAHHQAAVLKKAADKYAAKPRPKIGSVEEYMETALEGEFDSLDHAFYDSEPSLTKVLEKFLEQHREQFVVIVD